VKQLSFLSENVTVILDFEKMILNKLSVNQAFSSSVVVKGDAPLFEQIHDFFMVFISKFFWRDSQSHGFNFNGGSMFVRSAYKNNLVSFQSVVSSNNVCG